MASATLASSGTAAISRPQSSSTLIHIPSGSSQLIEPGSPENQKSGLMNYAHGKADVKRIERKNKKIFPARKPETTARPTGLLACTLEYLAVFHHELHIFQRFDVAQGVTTHRYHVRKRPRCNHPKLSVHVEHGGCARGRALNGIHRGHAQIHHTRELLRDRLGPWNSTHVRSKDNFHSSPQRFSERRLVQRNAQAVALSGRSARRSPIVVVGADRRNVPGALLQHLGNRCVIQVQAVLD